MKILHLDIETAPNTVHVWGLFDQNVSYKQVLDSSYTLCFAAKWDKKKKITFSSVHETTPRKMVKLAHDLITEADAIVHYNGSRFDIPTLNKEFITYDMTPPSPHKNIDLYQVCRKRFRFTSFKMDYVVAQLGLGEKVEHKGHQLWIDCMAADDKAWKKMKRYNIGDVRLTEKLYHSLMPWIPGHPNQNVYNDSGERVCVNCGGNNIQRRGWSYTTCGKYRRFCCQDCGKWMRGRFTMLSKETKETMLVAAV